MRLAPAGRRRPPACSIVAAVDRIVGRVGGIPAAAGGLVVVCVVVDGVRMGSFVLGLVIGVQRPLLERQRRRLAQVVVHFLAKT